MSLQSILKNLESIDENSRHKTEITEDRIMTVIDELRNLIAFYREYPDLFIDEIKGPDSTFNLYYYQRVFLRIAMRHRYVYATFPRA